MMQNLTIALLILVCLTFYLQPVVLKAVSRQGVQYCGSDSECPKGYTCVLSVRKCNPATAEITFPGAPDTVAFQKGLPRQMLTPNCTMTLQSVQAVNGLELRMPCKVTGKPMPRISWYHNGINIDQDEGYVITYNPENGDISLLIVEVFSEDEGEYECKARNPAGDAVTRATVVVV